MISIWCDGACSGNPGPGGYAAAIIKSDSTIEFQSGYNEYTTNNRMELFGFICALKMSIDKTINVDKESVIIFTDSKYIENAINCGWLNKWSLNGFSKIKNPDLWIDVYKIISKHNHITIKWVKGHSGIIGNDIVDRLAVEAMNLKRTSMGFIKI